MWDRSGRSRLPPALRDWLPEDDLAHFVLEALERVEIGHFKVNTRGTGDAQYHPRMMPALPIYCHANGIFSSRRIERATHRDIGLRYIAANTHPDHDSICKFRRENAEAIGKSFPRVLPLARELKLLKVGMVNVDGTKLNANAGKPAREPKTEWLKGMRSKLDSEAGREKYRLRKQTLEPLFGIIENVLNFRRFSLRGAAKVQAEWELVAPAYKRLHKLRGAVAQ